MNKQTNPLAPVRCGQGILIHASPERIWRVLTHIDKWPDWQKDIPVARLKDSLNVNAAFEWKTGGAKIHSTLHTVEPEHSFGWTCKTFGMYAIHNWTISPVNGGTEVTVDESMQGFLAGLFRNSFNKNLERGMQRWLDFLKAECEK